MALTYDQVTAITQKKFIPKMYDNIFDSNPLLQRVLRKRDGTISWTEESALSFLSFTRPLRLLVGILVHKLWILRTIKTFRRLSTPGNSFMPTSRFVAMKSLKNSGDSQILSLVKNKVKIAEKTLADTLGSGLYSDGTDSQRYCRASGSIVATDQHGWRNFSKF
jgi:hypothetical protein